MIKAWWTRGAYVVHEVAHATEGEDEEVNLLYEEALAWLVVRVEVLAQPGSRHGRLYYGQPEWLCVCVCVCMRVCACVRARYVMASTRRKERDVKLLIK